VYLQLVYQSFLYKTNQLQEEANFNDSLIKSILCIHLAYAYLAPRLSYFHHMNIVWPECSATIMELKKNKPDHFMFKEQEFVS